MGLAQQPLVNNLIDYRARFQNGRTLRHGFGTWHRFTLYEAASKKPISEICLDSLSYLESPAETHI